jgi:hypothetical protein
MPKQMRILTIAITLTVLGLPSQGSGGKSPKSAGASANANEPVLWREPTDIESRNLYYGPGGEEHQPQSPFRFVEEDLNGTNPKYVVLDRDNVKWTIKPGLEARAETVASRFVWAVGYFANEDYFLEDVVVGGLPAHLKRGRNLFGADSTLHVVRLKRHLPGEKAVSNWQWRKGPFEGTRELNGLKVVMALINNWDLKDVNNKIYSDRDSAEQQYVVSDLGASLGTTNLSHPLSNSKGNLNSYSHSRFISKVTDEYVDFETPSRPSMIYALWPPAFLRRIPLDNLAHRVPRADVKWIAGLLSRLSPGQIRDAFRAASYSPDDVEAFSDVIEARIAELSEL